MTLGFSPRLGSKLLTVAAVSLAITTFAHGQDSRYQPRRYPAVDQARQQRPYQQQQQQQQQRAQQPRQHAQQPQQRSYQVAERNAQAQRGMDIQKRPNEHPLMPALRWAYSGLREMEQIRDYSAVLVKRERIGDEVGDYERMFVKVRHEPFSVYLYFLAPNNLKGQECVYVENKNDGKMWAHGVGMRGKMFGTVSLKPDGVIAMQGQRYPLTEMGILNLTRRLVEVAEHDIKYGECEVKFYRGAKVADRQCTCIEAIHPVPRRNFRFHLARIFVDDELNVPIRYAAYSWPREKGGAPELIEEYTYLDLKLNPGFTDADFDINNPNYNF